MELLYPCLLLTFLLLPLLLLKLLPAKPSSRTTKHEAKLPPGPPKLPIIGSLHHLLRGPLPHRVLRDLAKTYGPLVHLQLGEVSHVVVSSKEVAREMLKTHDIKFSSRPALLAAKIIVYGGTDMIFAPYGGYWRELRKLCILEVLSARRVQSFRHVREEEVFDLVRRIRSMGSSSSVNLSEMLPSLMNDITARVAFGGKCKDAAAYLKAMKKVSALVGGFSLPDLFPSSLLLSFVTGIKHRLEKAHRTIDKILDGIVEEQKERRAAMIKAGSGETMEDNILDVLLNIQHHGEPGNILTTANIKAVIFDVFSAGSGTVSSSMIWTMAELMNNPRVMKKAQAEIRAALRGKTTITETDVVGGRLSYLKLVIKESLRLHPPAPLLIPRECTETCEIDGYVIPKGTRVVFNQWGMGRDPRYWGDDAEAFRPERFEGCSIDFKGKDNFEYMPFGAGRRMCPGVEFGLANMELALAQLLYYFDWSLPNGVSELDMAETFGLAARKKHDLCLHASLHDPEKK